MTRRKTLRLAVLVSTLVVAATSAHAARAAEQGEVIVVDNVGVPLYTHNFDTKKDITIGDKLLVSEFMGAHYFITDTIRVGMMVQWTEQYTGEVPAGADHFTTFALLPQIGWNFYDHFSTAAIFTYAPRAGGKDQLDIGVQALVGYGVPITDHASFNAAVEIPINFKVATTIGITPLVGLSMKL